VAAWLPAGPGGVVEGPTGSLRYVRQFGSRVRQEPTIKDGVEDLFGFAAQEGVGAGEGGAKFMIVEDSEHLGQLLRRRHERHVTVCARKDACR
jgi:hypothetical protein